MIVEIDHVRFAWKPGQRDILDIACLQIAAGERVFIEGPSGSGKSTLFSLLGGVVSPQQGTVRVLQADISRMPASKRDQFRADHIGFVFQMFNLVPYLSMIDNVVLPCRFSQRRQGRAATRSGSPEAEARRLLVRLGLELAELQARAVTELSIGQQQRVAIARALIGAPELIMADEPTSALDEVSRQRFLEVLSEQCDEAGVSLLFASHDARLGTWFDRRIAIAELTPGGSMNAIKPSEGV